MKKYRTKFEEIENLYIYYKYLKDINDIINDKSMNRRESEFEFLIYSIGDDIKDENKLTSIQKRYLIRKLENTTEIYHLLDAGYIYIWNLNNNQRNKSYYHRTLNHIRNLDWGKNWSIRKYNTMEKFFYFLKKDTAILETEKESLLERLFLELKNQAELENHLERELLSRINNYEDMRDLLGVFFST